MFELDTEDLLRVRVRRASDTEIRGADPSEGEESSSAATPVAQLANLTVRDIQQALESSAIDTEDTMSILARKKSRRRRNSEVDAIHKNLPATHISPAQLYSTESGHLYHAGKVCIILVGLPARGKTHHAVALTRYLRWLGVKAHAFHLGDYRRQFQNPGEQMPEDYFMVDASPETKEFRKKIATKCFEDLNDFFMRDNGQVAIYDAVNGRAAYRRELAKHFSDWGVYPFFIECLATDERLVMRNIRDVKITSPDYKDMDPDRAVLHYLKSIQVRIPNYEPMNETELSYVKMINVSEKIVMNAGKLKFGYLQNRIIYFLMNSRIKVGSIFFARAGVTETSEEDFREDAPLSQRGREYAQKLKQTLWEHIDKRQERAQKDHTLEVLAKTLKFKTSQEGFYTLIKPDADDKVHAVAGPATGSTENSTASSPIHAPMSPNEAPGQVSLDGQVFEVPDSSGASTPKNAADALSMSTLRAHDLNRLGRHSLTVWSSTRLKTVQTAEVFADEGIIATQRTQLNQLNPGEEGRLSPQELKETYPDEWKRHQIDPYHHRYPRAESYQDVAVRLEPLIMELERTSNDLLIIAHESVLRVLYGYLMACSVNDIPKLRFPVNELVEIVPNAYMNQANRIRIPGVDP